MSSGIAVDDQCKIILDEIKTKKLYRYSVFYIKQEKSISVEVKGGQDNSYEEFLQDLQREGEGCCRYGLFDFEYEHQFQGAVKTTKKQKLLLMLWCPDSAKIKNKMLYASSFAALKKSLVGVSKCLQVSDYSEAAASEVEKLLRTRDRV